MATAVFLQLCNSEMERRKKKKKKKRRGIGEGAKVLFIDLFVVRWTRHFDIKS